MASSENPENISFLRKKKKNSPNLAKIVYFNGIRIFREIRRIWDLTPTRSDGNFA